MADDSSVPPPLPPKPKALKSNDSNNFSLFLSVVVGIIAMVVAIFGSVFVTHNRPELTVEDNVHSLLERYIHPPAPISELSDLRGVTEFTDAQLNKLKDFRERRTFKPEFEVDYSKVRTVPIEVSRSSSRTDINEEEKKEKVKALIFRPIPTELVKNMELGEELPTLVYAHAGSFVSGSANDSWAVELALNTPAMVVSVEYPLAPEVKNPTAVLDIVDVMFYLMDEYNTFSVHVDKFGFAGFEAGAALAASAAIHMRNIGFKHSLKVLALGLPMLARPSTKFVSYGASEQSWINNDLAWDLYTGKLTKESKKECRKNILCSPFHNEEFDFIAPTLVYYATHDVLVHEAYLFHEKVLASGEFVQKVQANATHSGAYNRRDHNDTGFENFVKGVKDGFWPPESELDKALRKAKEYASIYS